MTYENIENLSMAVKTKDVMRACELWCHAEQAKNEEYKSEYYERIYAKRKYNALPFYKRWFAVPPLPIIYPPHFIDMSGFYSYVKMTGRSCHLADEDITVINFWDRNALRLAQIVKDYLDGKTL